MRTALLVLLWGSCLFGQVDWTRQVQNKPFADVREYGAKGDYRTFAIAAITSGSTTLTVTDGAFGTGDVGKTIVVLGAGVGGTALVTTIASRTSSTVVVVSAAASTTVNNAAGGVGTDSTAGIQAALNSLKEVSAGDNTGGGVVLLPAGVYFVSSTITIPNKVTFSGTSSTMAKLLPSPNFVAATPMVQIGSIIDNPGGVYGSRLENITLDGAGYVDYGVYSDVANENSGVRSCSIVNWKKYGIKITGYTAQNWELENLWVFPHTSVTACATCYGIDIDTVASTNLIKRATVYPTRDATGVGIRVYNSTVTLIDTHTENGADGILFDAGANGTVINTFGGPNANQTTVLRISASAGDVNVMSVLKNGATNVFKDDRLAFTSTDPTFGMYSSRSARFYGLGNLHPALYISNSGLSALTGSVVKAETINATDAGKLFDLIVRGTAVGINLVSTSSSPAVNLDGNGTRTTLSSSGRIAATGNTDGSLTNVLDIRNNGNGAQAAGNSVAYFKNVNTTDSGYVVHIDLTAGGGVVPFQVEGRSSGYFRVDEDGSPKIVTLQSQPICAVGYRGSLWVTQGGAGVKDKVEVCAKDVGDAYAWRTLY